MPVTPRIARRSASNSAEVCAIIAVRYEKCWLPLLNNHPDRPLVPPSDVEWVWCVIFVLHDFAAFERRRTVALKVGLLPMRLALGAEPAALFAPIDQVLPLRFGCIRTRL